MKDTLPPAEPNRLTCVICETQRESFQGFFIFIFTDNMLTLAVMNLSRENFVVKYSSRPSVSEEHLMSSSMCLSVAVLLQPP